MRPEETAPVRIGNEERAAAMKALDEHLAQGRLGVEEYGDRAAAAANAVHAPDLAALFADLPAPHPTLPGITDRGLVSADGMVSLTKPHHDPPPERVTGFLATWGPRLVALSPFAALALFVVTRQWWWFLLIPVAGALVYGGHGGRGRDRRR